jgi:hypothetical protein
MKSKKSPRLEPEANNTTINPEIFEDRARFVKDGAYDALLEALRPARMYDYIPKRRGVAEKASRGIYDPDYGLLTVHWLKPGEVWRVRLLPIFTDEHSPFLRQVQHWWWGHALVCPLGTDSALVQRHNLTKCPACDAGLEKSFSYILYAIKVDDLDRRHPLCLGLPGRYLSSIENLIEDGAFNFGDGRLVELRPDGNSLNHRLLGVMPEKKTAFVAAREILHLRPRHIWPARLKEFAAAYKGWKKAEEPEPEPGRHKRLQEIFPGCLFVPIPWGCKGPISPDWQTVEYQYTLTSNYCEQLDQGNIGLICGRDPRAISDGLVPDGIMVGVDADSDEFAAVVLEYNPWLNTTPCVTGGRGCKWFFRIESGEGVEKCLHSSKVKRDGREVGDWLATGKQGVISGLHPSGKMYRLTMDRKLRTVPHWQFKLPKDFTLESMKRRYHEVYRRAMGQQPFVGELLDVDQLHNVHYRSDGSYDAQCPACAASGKDSAGDNLRVWSTGHYKCVSTIGLSPDETHEHNSQVYELARLERQEKPNDETADPE